MKLLSSLLGLIFAQSLFGQVNATEFNEAFTKGILEGEVRTVYYGRSKDGSPYFPKANGLALGGHVGFITYPINNFSAQVALYTTQPLYGDGTSLAATNLVNGEDGYFLLGKANLRYDDGTHLAKIGRQEMMTPLAASDDARVIEDLFQVANFSTKVLDNHTIHGMYFDSMSGMDNGHEKKDWINMSQVLGTSYKKGMYAVGVENTSISNLKAELWYYDIPSTVYEFFAGAKYKHQINQNFLLSYEAHYWNSKSRSGYEKDLAQSVDYGFGGVRISADINDFTLQFAYDHMSKKAGSQTIHTYFGNYAEYTYGFLLGSGAYGAITTGDPDDDMTKMDAIKFTGQYQITSSNKLYLGYVINTSNQSSLQSDFNILDIAWFVEDLGYKNLSLAVIYENWDADGNNFFVDNNLIRATLKYKF